MHVKLIIAVDKQDQLLKS